MSNSPHPSLKSLEMLIGSWRASGGANVLVTFNWMEGGFFVVQDIDLDGIKGIEFIGYDEQSGNLRSHYFDDKGNALEYTLVISETVHKFILICPG